MAGVCCATRMRMLVAGVIIDRSGEDEQVSERMVMEWASWDSWGKGSEMSIIV